MCTINNINTEVESLKKLTNAYMRQDLNQMLRISEERKGNQCDPTPGEEDAMIYNRNKAFGKFVWWMGTVEKEAMALVEYMKKQGYTVEPVK